MGSLGKIEGIASFYLVVTPILKDVFKKQQPRKNCGKPDCSFYNNTNLSLRESYCYTPKAENCFFARKEGQSGMFSDPRSGQWFISSA